MKYSDGTKSPGSVKSNIMKRAKKAGDNIRRRVKGERVTKASFKKGGKMMYKKGGKVGTYIRPQSK